MDDLASLVSTSQSKERLDLEVLKNQYLVGKCFLEACTADVSSMEPHQRPSLAIGTPGRVLAEATSKSLGISFKQLKTMIEFAVAVSTLVHNCGGEALDVIFDPANPQSAKSVKQLSNTSDIRQRYRISKVLNNQSRTIRPQGSDSVFDTIAFNEVPSRLARARGVLIQLEDRFGDISDPEVKSEVRRLVKILKDAATQLGKLVSRYPPTRPVLKRLDKNLVFPILSSRAVTGRDVGAARQALRLTIKNVWDYPEMCRRGLLPTDVEKTKVCQELSVIKSTAKQILV